MIICYATKIGQTNKSIWEFSVTTVGNFQILHYHNDLLYFILQMQSIEISICTIQIIY
jgi:hypothetical protein